MSEKWCLIIDVLLTEEMKESLLYELQGIEYSFPTSIVELPIYTGIDGKVCVERQRRMPIEANTEAEIRFWIEDEYLEHEVRLSDITGEPRYETGS